MGRIGRIARRTFLVGSGAIAGGVVFGYYKYRQPYANPVEGTLTPYILIDGDGVTIITPRAEMGQGVQTTLAALVAEELDIAWEDVRVAHGPPSKAFYNTAMLSEGLPFPAHDDRWAVETARDAAKVPAKFLGLQVTGGSSSTPDAYDRMRRAGAAARLALVGAAAERLGVAPSDLTTQDGAVLAPGGTRIPYADLAEAAAGIDLPDDPPLKPRSEWRYLGTDMPRKDMLAKCTGTATFGADTRLPEMLFATVRMNPARDGGMAGFDAGAALAMRGIVDVVAMPGGGIGVLADNTWRAMRAVAAVACDWGDSPYPQDDAAIMATIAKGFETDPDSTLLDEGDVAQALEGAENVFEAQYSVPLLAHETMEPMSAVAYLKDGRLDLWTGTQAPMQARAVAATAAGIDESAVHIHVTYLGGGFGRRAETDAVAQAAHLARAANGRPVSLSWSREEDIRQDFYRPPAIARMRGRVADGTVTALDAAVSSPSVMAAMMGRMLGTSPPGPDKLIVDGLFDQPYGIADYRARGYRAPSVTPITSWRSVGNSFNGFFHESFIDELAHEAGADPMEMRLNLMAHDPSRRVLEAVAEMSGWGTPLAQGRGRGVAYHYSFGVPAAEVVEVSMTDSGIRMERAWAAVDIGIALDPRNIEAQVQSGMIFGLSAAINGRITMTGGASDQSNFHNADVLRIHRVPPIAVRILENGSKIRGIGEPGTPPAAPALANAIFAATGRRIRDLPLNREIDFA